MAVNQPGTHRQRLLAKDIQQRKPGNPREANTIDSNTFAMDVDFNVAPAFQAGRNQIKRLRIARTQELQRLVGKHHAKTEGGMCIVLLKHLNLRVGQVTANSISGI